MQRVKVQQKKIKSKGKEYTQLWIGLPKALTEAMQINAGESLEVFIERGDLILKI